MNRPVIIGLALAASPLFATGPRAGDVLGQDTQNTGPHEIPIQQVDDRFLTIVESQPSDLSTPAGLKATHPALIGTWRFNHTECYERTTPLVAGHDQPVISVDFAYRRPVDNKTIVRFEFAGPDDAPGTRVFVPREFTDGNRPSEDQPLVITKIVPSEPRKD